METSKPNPLDELKKLGATRLEELRCLGDDLFRRMSPRDLFTLLFPPALGLEVVRGTMAGRWQKKEAFDENACDEKLIDATLKMANWWSTHYFDTSIYDAHRLPKTTCALIVGNHSAGMMPIDALFAINEIKKVHGSDRRVYPLVHDFAYVAPRIARLAKRMGIIRADKENAIAALKSGGDVLAYPGGDRDAFRKFSDRKKVVLAERKGFVQVALSAGVPIVPLVSVGLHESFFVLAEGKNAAERLGLKNVFRTETLPLAITFPWGLVPAFVPFLPLPTSIEMQFCKPIQANGSPDDEKLVNSIYTEVHNSMQKTMDELYKNRTTFFGRT